MEIKLLTEQQKYKVVDALEKIYKFSYQYLIDNRSKVFGVVINTPNKNGETMQSCFGTEQAVHITNLFIKRLVNKNNVVDFDSLVK